ncbi:hypothetical protein HYT01_04405 [Candidatus Giovannonibacteria bacterium]|nr:hypothetical protein [Candidatus Giovannonibacteria bacterium]
MKKVLVTDWGQVLFHVDHSAVENLIIEGRIAQALELVEKLDKNLVSPSLALNEFNRYYFKEPLKLTEFVSLFTGAWHKVNAPLLKLYNKLKKKGVRIAAITDISEMTFYSICKRFPKAIGLFFEESENPAELIITSFEARAVKKNFTPFSRACSRFGFSPEEALFVDNDAGNIEIASALGFETFLYEINSASSNALLENLSLKLFFPHLK